jgi:hypothetical protein
MALFYFATAGRSATDICAAAFALNHAGLNPVKLCCSGEPS